MISQLINRVLLPPDAPHLHSLPLLRSQVSDWWLSQWSQDTKVWYTQDVVPSNPDDAGTDYPYESLNASQAYIITYAICVLFFLASM